MITLFGSRNSLSQDLQKYNSDREVIEGVVIPNTELFKIHSEIADLDFLIYVQLPWSYDNNPDKKYPVWYNTDANRGFPLVANASTFLTFPPGDMPEMIIVGIGYLIDGMEDWAAWRTRDLTPTSDPETDKYWKNLLTGLSGRTNIVVKSGGAPIYLNFIIEELIPHIDTNYRTLSDDRTLGGYSYGGLFTFYTLFHHPESFKRYFAGSPSLDFDHGVIFNYEDDYASTHHDLIARVFITAGSLEGDTMIDQVKKMEEKLMSRGYPSLRLKTHVFEDEDHRSCVGAAFIRAFKVLSGDW